MLNYITEIYKHVFGLHCLSYPCINKIAWGPENVQKFHPKHVQLQSARQICLIRVQTEAESDKRPTDRTPQLFPANSFPAGAYHVCA